MLWTVRILGVAALLGAGVVLGLSLAGACDEEKQVQDVWGPSAIERFQQAAETLEPVKEKSPLLVQAEILAAYLKPQAPILTASPNPKPTRQADVRLSPAVSPPAPSPRFILYATSYYPQRPERSMALISEASGADGHRRWVREGDQIGHFVVQEIRRGSILCRTSGDEQVHEVAMEHGPPGTIFVRGHAGLAQSTPTGGLAGGAADANGTREEVP
jgi:hypothetical protein